MSILRNKRKIFVGIISGIILVLLIGIFVTSPTRKFPASDYFIIKPGESLTSISLSLEESHIIRSPFIFKSIVALIYLSGNRAHAGSYYFEKPLSTFTVAWRIIHGDFIVNPIKITIPEGLNKFEIAELVKKYIPSFDTKSFIEKANEGYIFPDTYFFAEGVKPEEVIRATKANFDQNAEKLGTELKELGKSLSDVVKIASILEREAAQTKTRKIIAGILWKRIELGMPLQVDVSFKYINGKTSSQLTINDLEIDSPFNSYKYKGLPPTPISNPGLDSIMAALNPIKTDYLYFVSDKDGEMHFAVTFDEHKKNKAKYLSYLGK